MPRKQDKAVPEGNGPVPYYDEFGPDQPTTADLLYRMIIERFDKFDRNLETMKSHFNEQDEVGQSHGEEKRQISV